MANQAYGHRRISAGSASISRRLGADVFELPVRLTASPLDPLFDLLGDQGPGQEVALHLIAAHQGEHILLGFPVRQWVLSLPIPLRLLLAAQPQLLTPVLQVVHRVLSRFLLDQAGLAADEAGAAEK